MNVENILKVADAIESHSIPELGFNMGTFIGAPNKTYGDLSGHNCGTVACVAGWSFAVRNGSVTPAKVNVDLFDWGAEGVWLGMERDLAFELFHGYPNAATTKPEQAVRTLHHLAATGEVNWTIAAPAISSQPTQEG